MKIGKMKIDIKKILIIIGVLLGITLVAIGIYNLYNWLVKEFVNTNNNNNDRNNNNNNNKPNINSKEGFRTGKKYLIFNITDIKDPNQNIMTIGKMKFYDSNGELVEPTGVNLVIPYINASELANALSNDPNLAGLGNAGREYIMLLFIVRYQIDINGVKNINNIINYTNPDYGIDTRNYIKNRYNSMKNEIDISDTHSYYHAGKGYRRYRYIKINSMNINYRIRVDSNYNAPSFNNFINKVNEINNQLNAKINNSRSVLIFEFDEYPSSYSFVSPNTTDNRYINSQPKTWSIFKTDNLSFSITNENKHILNLKLTQINNSSLTLCDNNGQNIIDTSNNITYLESISNQTLPNSPNTESIKYSLSLSGLNISSSTNRKYYLTFINIDKSHFKNSILKSSISYNIENMNINDYITYFNTEFKNYLASLLQLNSLSNQELEIYLTTKQLFNHIYNQLTYNTYKLINIPKTASDDSNEPEEIKGFDFNSFGFVYHPEQVNDYVNFNSTSISNSLDIYKSYYICCIDSNIDNYVNTYNSLNTKNYSINANEIDDDGNTSGYGIYGVSDEQVNSAKNGTSSTSGKDYISLPIVIKFPETPSYTISQYINNLGSEVEFVDSFHKVNTDNSIINVDDKKFMLELETQEVNRINSNTDIPKITKNDIQTDTFKYYLSFLKTDKNFTGKLSDYSLLQYMTNFSSEFKTQINDNNGLNNIGNIDVYMCSKEMIQSIDMSKNNLLVDEDIDENNKNKLYILKELKFEFNHGLIIYDTSDTDNKKFKLYSSPLTMNETETTITDNTITAESCGDLYNYYYIPIIFRVPFNINFENVMYELNSDNISLNNILSYKYLTTNTDNELITSTDYKSCSKIKSYIILDSTNINTLNIFQSSDSLSNTEDTEYTEKQILDLKYIQQEYVNDAVEYDAGRLGLTQKLPEIVPISNNDFNK